MDKYQKIDKWLQGIATFLLGVAFSSMLSYSYHLGNWLGALGYWFAFAVSALCLAGVYVSRQRAKAKT
jgi:hypothetical protein